MRPILHTLLCLTLFLVLSACGDEASTPTPVSATPTATATASPTPTATATPTPTPTPTAVPVCGDGLVRGLETCDDGDTDPGDGCSPTCEIEYFWQCAGEPSLCVADENNCGDGLIQQNEACDDGGTASGDGCSESCEVETFYSCEGQPSFCSLLPPACGDGLIHPDEFCDDGNLDLGDGCSPACEVEAFYDCEGEPSVCTLVDADCGDGLLHPAEACDNGELNSDSEADACRTDCTEATCGDGVVDAGEGCDDGELNSDSEGATCRSTCRLPGCGDGVLDDGEICDDGLDNNNTLADACRTNCVDAFCGDGVVDRGEVCDAGDNNSDIIPDACRSTCEPATCGDGTIDGGEICDDGALNSDSLPGTCRSDCVPATCGDGVIDPGEACDEGVSNVDGVLGSCTTSCNVNLSYEKVLTLSSSGTQVLGSLEDLDERIFQDAASCIARFDDRIAKVHTVERFDGGLYLDLAPMRAFVEGDPSFDYFVFLRLAPGQNTTAVVTKRSGQTEEFLDVSRDITANPTLDTAVDVFCERVSDYERVAIFAGDGSSLLGTFGDAYQRVVEEAQDCKASVQGRIFPVVHVDYDDLTLRLDALSLAGGFKPRRETYAFAEIALGTRAGLGVSNRRNEVGNIWKRDRDQSSVLRFDEAPLTLFCADRYELVSTFIPSGEISSGADWDALYSRVVEEGQRCKLDFDSRLATSNVVYFEEGHLRFELGNHHTGLGDGARESTSFVSLERGVRTGITGLHRAGDAGQVIQPLMSQSPESGTSVQDFAVKVFCEPQSNDPEVFKIGQDGQQLQGEWSRLFDLVTQEGVQCRVRSADSISNPVHLEYESGTLRFDYAGLLAHEGRGESYGAHILNQLSEVVFAASTRPDDDDRLLRRDVDQGPIESSIPMDLDLICE